MKGSVTLRTPLGGAPVIWGTRPQDVEVQSDDDNLGLASFWDMLELVKCCVEGRAGANKSEPVLCTSCTFLTPAYAVVYLSFVPYHLGMAAFFISSCVHDHFAINTSFADFKT